jgi:hypothetical protein
LDRRRRRPAYSPDAIDDRRRADDDDRAQAGRRSRRQNAFDPVHPYTTHPEHQQRLSRRRRCPGAADHSSGRSGLSLGRSEGPDRRLPHHRGGHRPRRPHQGCRGAQIHSDTRRRRLDCRQAMDLRARDARRTAGRCHLQPRGQLQRGPVSAGAEVSRRNLQAEYVAERKTRSSRSVDPAP